MPDCNLHHLNTIFLSLGEVAAINTRAMLTHYEPWKESSFSIAPEQMRQNGQRRDEGDEVLTVENIADAIGANSDTANPLAKPIARAGDWFARALKEEGHSRETLNRAKRFARSAERNSRGIGEVLFVYDEMTIAASLQFTGEHEKKKAESRLLNSRALTDCADLSKYVNKVEPFYTDVETFLIDYAMFISDMPGREVTRFAIGHAFANNGITVTDRVMSYFK